MLEKIPHGIPHGKVLENIGGRLVNVIRPFDKILIKWYAGIL